MNITAYSLAQRYVGIREIAGDKDHPLVQWWLSLCGYDLDVHDEVPWCSAFPNGICWELSLPRTKSAASRSWLMLGTPTPVDLAKPEFDVVILTRGSGPQPGPSVLNAPGHVGFFAGLQNDQILVLGGNQDNGISITHFPIDRVLGIRRLVV